jgi:hypothetical protein
MDMYIKQISDVGTSNPIVARLSIQTNQILQFFFIDEKLKEEIYGVLGVNVQNRLISCFKIYSYIDNEIMKIDKEITEKGLQKNGIAVNVPTILDLNEKCENFLYQAKSALRDLSELLNIFYDCTFNEARYDKVYNWATEKFGATDDLTKLIRNDHDIWIKRIVSMRNAIEHPGGYSGELTIKNIEFLNKTTLSEPKWILNNEKESSILKDMNTFISNMIEFCEELFVTSLNKLDTDMPIVFYEIPVEERDSSCPIRLKANVHPDFINDTFGKK